MFRPRRQSLGPMLCVTAAIAAGLAAIDRPAAAYARKVTGSGALYKWSGASASMEVHLTSVPGLTPEDITQAASAAARSWTDSVPCTSARLDLTFADGDGPPTANDGRNVIAARPDGWCVAGGPDPPPGQAACNDPSAIAVTSVFADGGSGRILGADTQLNTLTAAWAVLDQNGAPADRQDLQAALTHELGHVLGLEHPCWSGTGVRATDDRGQPVPDCYSAPADIQLEAMFPSFDPGDLSKRTLSPEDVRAICEIYPLASGKPDGSQGGGCAVAGAVAASDLGGEAAIWLLFGAVAVAARSRRRSA
jgi:hypothetical protein